MAIYDKSGSSLSEAFAYNADVLSKAYNLGGSEVFSWLSPYEDYTISNIGGTIHSGIDIYEDVIAEWIESSQSFRLSDLSTFNQIVSLSADTVGLHGNDISFTEEFYAQSDTYPLIYVMGKYTGYFYRITNSTITKVRTITLPDEANNFNLAYGHAFDGNIMHLIGYRYSYQQSTGNFIRIMTLDMSDLTDNGDGTYTPALLNIADREWLECIQGASFHDDMMWISCGIGTTAHVYAINPYTGHIIVDIDMTETDHSELEGNAWAYNNSDGWYVVFGQRTTGYNGYKKIVFTTE